MPAVIAVVFALMSAVALAVRRVAPRRPARTGVCADTLPLRVCEREHERRVARVAAQLRARSSTAPVSLRKRSVSHQVPKAGDLKYKDEPIDIGELQDIVSIDVAARVCVAEAGVTFVDLVRATLAHGLVPVVVPELKTITVGGAVSGCSLESMSFRYGGFHDSCLEYEVVTAAGEVLTCTPDNDNALLFQMMHGSFGTLGILTKLTFRLVPAKRYVKVKNEKYATLEEYVAAIEGHYRRRDVDFMDGILHSPKELVLCAGHFVDEAPYTNRYDWTKVYFASTRKRAEDYLDTEQYFFRYDHGVTQVHPKSFLGRLLFAKLFGSSRLLRVAEKLNRFLDGERPNVVLDVFLPLSRMTAFLDWHDKELGHWPLWCVPYKRVRDYEWIHPSLFDGIDDELFVDLAIYGMKQPPGKNAYRMIEEKLPDVHGIKTLISHNYYGEDEFWRTWNRENYDRVKSRTDPKNIFRDLYTKTCKAARGLTS